MLEFFAAIGMIVVIGFLLYLLVVYIQNKEFKEKLILEDHPEIISLRVELAQRVNYNFDSDRSHRISAEYQEKIRKKMSEIMKDEKEIEKLIKKREERDRHREELEKRFERERIKEEVRSEIERKK